MSKTFALRIGAVVGATILLLAGCAPAPEKPGAGDEGEQFCARMITNSGGLEDRSFNETSWRAQGAKHRDGHAAKRAFDGCR